MTRCAIEIELALLSIHWLTRELYTASVISTRSPLRASAYDDYASPDLLLFFLGHFLGRSLQVFNLGTLLTSSLRGFLHVSYPFAADESRVPVARDSIRLPRSITRSNKSTSDLLLFLLGHFRGGRW